MYRWGRNNSKKRDQRGIGVTQNFHSLLPREIQIVINGYKQRIIQISCGFFHSMCLTEQHQVFSWGNGGNGRLGHGDTVPTAEPKLIEALVSEKIIKISAGDKHSG